MSFRVKLTPAFLAAAGRTYGEDVVTALLSATEYVRRNILEPSSRRLEDIAIERKEIEGQRVDDAKTFSIKTDHECEAEMEKLLSAAFPDALLISEEKYGQKTADEKRLVLQEARTTNRRIVLTDPLDGTRDFRTGGDGYSVMTAVAEKGEIVAAVAHRCTDHADPSGLGHTLTYEQGDGLRLNGAQVRSLSTRVFPSDPKALRGYAGVEFQSPELKARFDSLSDLWTCAKAYEDMVTGRHHFMLVAAPVDIFDYTAGIAFMRAAGGVARFADGAEATLTEVLRRQPCMIGDSAAGGLYNTLIFAVSENVYASVKKNIFAAARKLDVVPKPGN